MKALNALNAHERHVTLGYLTNISRRIHGSSSHSVREWLVEHRDLVGLASVPEDWQGIREVLQHAHASTAGARMDRTAKRLHRLGVEMGLSQTDIVILGFLVGYETQPVIENLVDTVGGGSTGFPGHWSAGTKSTLIPALLGLPAVTVNRHLSPEAPLVKQGLVTVDPKDGDARALDRLSRLVFLPGPADGDVRNILFEPAPPAELGYEDFDHIADDRDHAAKLLKGALEAGEPGVHVLFHGPPGTGKTSLAATLATHLGVPLYVIGEADDHGREPNREERLAELRMAGHLLGPGRNAILLVDEGFDDLDLNSYRSGIPFFDEGLPRRRTLGSKVFVNKLIERAPLPVLWCTNDARSISPAIRDRMTFSIPLQNPPAEVMAGMWQKLGQENQLGLEYTDSVSLAKDFDVSPRAAARSVKAARLGGGGLSTIRRNLASVQRLAGGKPPRSVLPGWYDPTLLAADEDVVQLADRLVETGERQFSVLLSGPPGSGKSEYARYLAGRLGMRVMERRASDLLGMYVGETEQAMANMFAAARDTRSFLIIDEIEGLLSDRSRARHSWELSSVDEMLGWLESHPQPFAATTNMSSWLDPATQRRFTFRVTLGYLSREQVTAAFCGFFGMEAPAAVRELTNLTPGDFQVVRRRAKVMGVLENVTRLREMLSKESQAKADAPKQMGFGG